MNDNGTIREYDANGNLIHYKNSNGIEYWREYDANGNLIHYKESNGYETWREYDANGNLIHYKDGYGVEYWREYDANGKMIHYKDSFGFEKWKQFDAKGNCIHYKNSDGVEEWYDSDGNVIDKPATEGYNSTMNDTTHYIVKNSKFKCGYLRRPIGVCDDYIFTPSAHEGTKFNDLDHAQRHIKIYSEMHSLNEIDFEILEVTVQHTYKQVVTKQMALKCVGILSGAYSCQERIDAKTMLNTYIEQRN